MRYEDFRALRGKLIRDALSDEERTAAIVAVEQHIKDDYAARLRRWEENTAKYPRANHGARPRADLIDAETAQLLADLRRQPSPLDTGWRRGGDWSIQRDREAND